MAIHQRFNMYLVSTAVLAVGIASPAFAQDVSGPESPKPTSVSPSPSGIEDPAQESGGLADIIVTARKVSENLQDVPVAVTVQTGESLEQQSAVRTIDIARLTPGLTLAPSTSQPSGFVLTVRGQIQTDALSTLDPSVGTYVDGFYWPRVHGLNADLLDVQSVQVLRGPQGTLFGRNTTGGAVLFQTNDPSYDGISGRISGTYGRFNERSGSVVLNLPLIADTVALRGAFSIGKRDGFFRNTLSGAELGDRDSYSARVKLLVNPTSNLSLLFSAELFRTDTLSRPFQTRYVAPNSAANTEAALEANPANAALLATAAGRAQLNTIGQTIFADYIDSIRDTDNVAANYEPENYAETQTYTGTATLDTSFGAIKFIGGYRKINAHTQIDLEGSPVNVVETGGLQDLESYSGELQFTGKAFNDAVDFVGGMFAFQEDGRDQSTSTNLPVVTRVSSGGVLGRTFYVGDITTRSMGMYAQATLRLSDQLSAVGGLRYSVEDKNLVSFNRDVNADTGAFLRCRVTGPGGGVGPICRTEARDDFDGISYTLGLNYQVTPDILVYAKTSKGFRSGGQQLRANGPALSAYVSFRPEVAREHEVGFKTEFFDRRVRFNVAAYYNDVSDIQRSTLNVISDPVTGAISTATVLGNAGKARFYGGEAELTARLFDGFTVGGTVALTDPTYLEYFDLSPTGDRLDRRDETFQQVPERTFSIAGDYEHDFGSFTLQSHLDYAWQGRTQLYASRTALTGNATTDAINVAIFNAVSRPPGGELNGRLSVLVMDEALELSVFGRNILNRRIDTTALILPAPLNIVSGQRNDPVTYGVTARFSFGQ